MQPASILACEERLTLTIAETLTTAVSVPLAMIQVRRQAAICKIPPAALRGALAIVMSFPPDVLGATGPATQRMLMLNQIRRAQFTVNAAERIARAVADARSRGQDVARAFYDAVQAEQRWYAQHLLASWSRADAAARVDSAAMQYGLLLGWNATEDDRTTAECRWADGRNFRADSMPLIGYPGMVHVHCRCWASRPHPGAPILPSAERRPVSGHPAQGRRVHASVPAIA